MPRRAGGWGFALLAGLALSPIHAAPAGAAWLPLEEIPVESHLYRDIEALATTYGTVAGYLSTRPWTRADLVAFLTALETRDPRCATDPAFARLRRETPDATGSRAWPPLATHEEEGRRLEFSPYVHTGYSQGSDGIVQRDHRVGGRVALELGSVGLLAGDVFAGTHSPGGHGNPANSRRFAIVESVDFNSYFDRAVARIAGHHGRVTLGHTWLRWGPGRSGTLALSDAAPAFDVIEFRAPIVRRVGLAWFVAALDPVTGTYLAGHRLKLRPWDALELGVAEHARFDGVENAALYLVPFVPYAHFEKRNLAGSDLASDSTNSARFKNNVMWSADLAWRPAPGMRAWGEMVVDDISFASTWRPNAIGWQAGAAWRTRVVGGHPIEAWSEYSRVYRYTYSVEHGHDFAFGGRPLGYGFGPDVENIEGALAVDAGTDVTLVLNGTITNKGEFALGDAWSPSDGQVEDMALAGVVERTVEAGLSAAWTPARGLYVSGRVGRASVEAPNHVAGARASHTMFSMRLAASW